MLLCVWFGCCVVCGVVEGGVVGRVRGGGGGILPSMSKEGGVWILYESDGRLGWRPGGGGGVHYVQFMSLLSVSQIDEYLADKPELRKQIEDDTRNHVWYLGRD